jgi:hypothetical protein
MDFQAEQIEERFMGWRKRYSNALALEKSID